MGKINYERSSRSDFNNSTEREVQNRIGAYNLDKLESSKIWELVQSREKELINEKTKFKENYQEYVKAEYDRLRAERVNNPQLNLGPRYSSDRQLYHQASDNVRVGYLQREKNIYKSTDREIDNVLQNARENGRGPSPEMRRDFQRAHDHDQNHDRR